MLPETEKILSWGRVNRFIHHLQDFASPLDSFSDSLRPLLPFGLGRSYGDSCLNDKGTLLLTRGLRRFLSFDPVSGLLEVEAGVSLEEIIRFAIPRGFFLPVTPGTKFVTVGGAVANDVHGKNHHAAGTFSHHLKSLELRRSDDSRLNLSPTENAPIFNATIGGLGLTGLITRVELKLSPVPTSFFDVEKIRFSGTDEFFAISRESDSRFAYTVAWLDLASRRYFGRGVFIRGNHCQDLSRGLRLHPPPLASIPFSAPKGLLNPPLARLHNSHYYHNHSATMRPGGIARSVEHYDKFFYPLDILGKWNLLYGEPGFYQWQCVVNNRDAVNVILDTIKNSSQTTYLAVLKNFGELKSLGNISFPSRGSTLAMDLPNLGKDTLRLLDVLDAIVIESGGSIYPAKDARMSPSTFCASFPGLDSLLPHLDPAFSSSFWRRVRP